MSDTNHSSGACCGGTSNAVQVEPRQPLANPAGGKGCDCGNSKEAASEFSFPEPVAAENADGGCCGGK